MIPLGTYPPLREVASWDGKTVLTRCDHCGCSVSPDHEPGGTDCRDNLTERAAKTGGW